MWRMPRPRALSFRPRHPATPNEQRVHTVDRLKLASLIVGVVLFAYGIKADNGTVRMAAIVVLVAGLALRFVKVRRQDESSRQDS